MIVSNGLDFNLSASFPLSMQIPVISDLSVGSNLQDHIYAHGVHFTVNAPITISEKNVMSPKNLIKYFTEGRGPMTSLGGVEVRNRENFPLIC